MPEMKIKSFEMNGGLFLLHTPINVLYSIMEFPCHELFKYFDYAGKISVN